MTAKIKLEKALTAYVKSLVAAAGDSVVSKMQVYEGHEAKDKQLPSAMVYVESVTQDEDFPPGEGILVGRVKLYVLTQAQDEESANQNLRVATLQAGMYQRDAVLDFTNVSDPDEREVTGIHLYDIYELDEGDGLDAQKFGEVIEYEVRFQGVDGSV